VVALLASYEKGQWALSCCERYASGIAETATPYVYNHKTTFDCVCVGDRGQMLRHQRGTSQCLQVLLYILLQLLRTNRILHQHLSGCYDQYFLLLPSERLVSLATRALRDVVHISSATDEAGPWQDLGRSRYIS
jgi:hypothetical protein